MHILHLYKDYFPVLGGIENHIKVLAEAQALAGHDVTVLVCARARRTQRETLNGVTVLKAGRLGNVAGMPLSLAQPWQLSKLRPDIVHVHSPYPLGEAANWLLGRGRATVITHHSDVVRQRGWLQLYGPLLRRVLRAADRIVATSPRYIESSPWLRPVRDRCTVIPLGVDVSRFVPKERAPADPPQILFVGRLRYYKALDILLRALTQVPQARLTVVGDGEMEEAWVALSRRLGLAERVTFAGEVADADLPGHYQRADLFVLPSNARAEAFGVVLLEAMASGLPCITTELGTGTSWIVQDGVTGRVVPPADPQSLASAINRLLADDGLRQEMGRQARRRAMQEFSEEKMITRTLELYKRVLESSPTR